MTRIETDAVATPAPRAPGKATAKVETDDDEKAPGIGERRRALRELLAARLAAARTRLEDARKALADGEDPREGDKQIVQQHHVRDGRRPGRTPAPRSNCMSQKTSDGRPIWNCPTPIPGEAHFARQKGLEDAVRIAEDEVSEAERAYRRGVD